MFQPQTVRSKLHNLEGVNGARKSLGDYPKNAAISEGHSSKLVWKDPSFGGEQWSEVAVGFSWLGRTNRFATPRATGREPGHGLCLGTGRLGA